MAPRALPSIAAGAGGLARYLEETRRFPMLEPGEEYMLAKAWSEQGNSGKAVQVLNAALEKKSRILLEQSLLTVPIWLRLQAQLTQLYREMGRDADALKIEDELRKRLVYADPDHPILRQLDRTKELALLEPTNN